MASSSNNLSLSAIGLRTTKAKGLGATSSNVVEDLSSSVTTILGETYWAISSMTKSATGTSNTKKIVYLTSEGSVVTVNPANGTASTKVLGETEYATPACKQVWNDYDYGIVTLDSNELRISTSIGSGRITLTNQFITDATVSALAYKCDTNASEFFGAMIHSDGTDIKVVLGSNMTKSTSVDIVPEDGSILNLFVSSRSFLANPRVAIVETKTDGTVIVRRIEFGSTSFSEPAITMQTTGLTGKICDPFATDPVFYGYKADGLYSVTGEAAPVKVVDTSGITGIAVFTKYGLGCEAGYIYREAGGDCRDNTGKRTDPVVGTMINDYNFNLVKLNAAIATEQEMIEVPSTR